MKNLILVLLIAVSAFQIVAQPTENVLTPTQFENIKINNASLRQIWDSGGDVNQVKSLLGDNVTVTNQDPIPGALSRLFTYSYL
ncbi:MAG: hypothetical protein RLP12_17065 [Ekhidna sp.]